MYEILLGVMNAALMEKNMKTLVCRSHLSMRKYSK